MKRRIVASTLAIAFVMAAAPAMAARAPAGGAVNEATGAPRDGSPGGPAPKTTPAQVAAFAKLPDWSGVWQGTGSLFDQSHGIRDGNAVAQHARDYPPYNAKWEARYEKFLNEVTWKGKQTDPLTLCYPPGFPRLASVPFGIEFVPTLTATYIIYERNPVRFIFTDGRPHPGEDDLFPSWEGHSIGHWEGDTLVVDTVGLHGGTLVDRTGLTFSDQLHITERIRRIGMDQMEDVLTLTDPVSMTRPWTVRRLYNRQKEKFAAMGNIACAESQRNPIVNGETTIVLGADRPGASGLYPPEIAPFAVPYGLDKPE